METEKKTPNKFTSIPSSNLGYPHFARPPPYNPNYYQYTSPIQEKGQYKPYKKILYEDIVPLSTILVVFIFWQVLMIIITFPYMFAWLNVLWTFEFLTTSDIPKFSSDLYMGLGTFWFDRYFTDWWVVLSDGIYFAAIIQQTISLAGIYIKNTPQRTQNTFVLAAFIFIKIVTLATRIYEIIFCDKFNICRGNPPNPQTADPVFVYMLAMNAAWIVFLFIYYVFSSFSIFENDVKGYMKRMYERIIEEKIDAKKEGFEKIVLIDREFKDFKYGPFSFFQNVGKNVNLYTEKVVTTPGWYLRAKWAEGLRFYSHRHNNDNNDEIKEELNKEKKEN